MELWDHLPRTEDSLRCVAVLAVTLSIGGCFGGGGIGRLSIKGYVTEIDTTNFERFVAGLRYSSPSVQGATVAITGTGHVATTNSRGEFTFYDVPPGVYNVMVMKDGWASSAAYNVMAMSTTVHYSVFDLTVELGERGLLSQSVSTANETYGMPRHLQMIESGVRPLAMPAGSDAAIYCDVLWNNNDPTVKGFKVYRDGIFIGQLPASESESGSLLMNPNPIPEIMPPVPEYYYTDGSSKLTPNAPVSYSVSAYNSWGEGNKSASVTVTPLNALSEVIVVQPQISAIVPGPGDYLHFQWNKVPNAKLYYIDVISADGTLMWEGYAYGNENSVVYGDPARTIWESGSLTPGQYYFFIRAFNFRENPPVPFDFNWIPKEVSSSASKLGMFNIL